MHNLRTFFIVIVLLAASNARALVNGEVPAEDDNRFDAVAAFSQTVWLTDDDKDKVNHNWFGAGVLVAPDVVLLAKHLLPVRDQAVYDKIGRKYMVRFRRNAAGSLGSKEAGPGSYHQVTIDRWVMVDGADLALGILNKPVTHIQPVRLLLEDIEVKDTKCMLAAWGSESHWKGIDAPRTALKIGENTVTSAGAGIQILSYQTEDRAMFDGKIGSYIIDTHAVPNMFDSGGSIFIFDEEGKPALAGIISTYTGGSYLPGVVKNTGFPLEAATQGARALLDAIEKKRKQ